MSRLINYFQSNILIEKAKYKHTLKIHYNLFKNQMLRKKNYSRASQYEYSQIFIPKPLGGRKIIYFRRYKPSQELQQQTNKLYDILQNNQQILKNGVKETFNRVIQAITFDSSLDPAQIKRIYRLLGKIRKVEVGESKQKGRQLYFALITYKFEFDLVKAFNLEYFQSRIDDQFRSVRLNQTKQGRQQFAYDLAKEQGMIEEEDQKIKKLREEGFQVVTGKSGRFKVDKEYNEKFVADLPQNKRKAKSKLRKEQQQYQEELDQEE